MTTTGAKTMTNHTRAELLALKQRIVAVPQVHRD